MALFGSPEIYSTVPPSLAKSLASALPPLSDRTREIFSCEICHVKFAILPP